MIELDELLTGMPTWPQVAEFFRSGEFYDERYLVEAIKKHLLTEEQRSALFVLNFSIEDMLNGRIEGGNRQLASDAIFDAWNDKLGFKHFGG